MSVWWMGVLFGAAAVGTALAAERWRRTWARPLAGLGTLLTLASTAWGLLLDPGQSLGEQILRREMGYTAVSTEVLGRHLAELHPGARAVVIYPLRHQRDEARLEALLEGLERGFGDRVRIVYRHDPVEPAAYRVADPEHDKEGYEHLSLDDWFNAEYFDRMFRRRSYGCDLIVSLAGLPGDAEKMRFWSRPDRPQVAVAYQGAPRLRDLVKEGKVCAAVTTKTLPEADPSGPPADARKAFDQRFELLAAPEAVSSSEVQ